MQQVKVNRLDLLAKIKENRGKHNAIFLEAQISYREAAITFLEKSLADARAGKKIRRSIELTAPVNQIAEYDRAIGMLEMSVDQFITLSASEFENYVLDKWHWSNQFVTSNGGYRKMLQDETPGYEE